MLSVVLVCLAGAVWLGNRAPGFQAADAKEVGPPVVSLSETKPETGDEGVDTIVGQIKRDFCSLFSWSCTVGTSKTAAGITGATKNSKTDFSDFLTALCTYGSVCLVCIALFCYFRLRFPELFMHYEKGGHANLDEQAPCAPAKTLLGWVWPTMMLGLTEALSMKDIENACGLDAAMLIEFCHMMIKMFALIGMPLLVITPTTALFGGNRFKVSGLNRLGVEALMDESPFFWFHALFVWYVIAVVGEQILERQRSFQQRRYEWLKGMPEPRGNTILVQRIPEEHCSDDALRKYFSDLFSEERITFASVVKNTGSLQALMKSLEEAEELEKASKKPMDEVCSSFSDGASHPEHQELRKQIDETRERILEEAKTPGSAVNTNSGFVSFLSRRDAQAALLLQYSGNTDYWVVSRPPSPEDVFWEDLTHTPAQEKLGEVIGYTIVVLLYLGFVPIVVAITNAAKYAQGSVESQTWLAGIFAVIVPTLGLLIFTSFLPTVLIIVFDKFFVTKATMWLQVKLQDWYFIFQVIFVLLVTLVGSSLLDAATRTLSRPLSLGMAMAHRMPHYSTFYMNYMLSQCMSNAMELTRYINVIKFVAHRSKGPSTARELSEPEDQDYYGIGSRSARWTACALVGLVFCPICPLICLVTLIYFVLCKLIYGYLLVFAETRKVDLGGAFWVNQLRHLQSGLWIFWLLMSGELTARAQPRQALLATLSGIYLVRIMRRFSKLTWMDLPFEEVEAHGPSNKPPTGVYIQPELRGLAVQKRVRRAAATLLPDNSSPASSAARSP